MKIEDDIERHIMRIIMVYITKNIIGRITDLEIDILTTTISFWGNLIKMKHKYQSKSMSL